MSQQWILWRLSTTLLVVAILSLANVDGLTSSNGNEILDCGFICNDGMCISSTKRCDNVAQCRDSSDELNCTCAERLGGRKLCDGIEDCPLAEDEVGCNGCRKDEFSCGGITGTNICLPYSKVCNGLRDGCPNNEDEQNCFRLQTFETGVRGVLSENGFLQKRIGQEWFTVCRGPKPDYVVTQYAIKACEGIVGDLDPLSSPRISNGIWPKSAIPPHLSSTGFALLGDSEAKFGILLNGECPSETIINVSCPPPKCGWPVRKYDKTKLTGRRTGRSLLYEDAAEGLTGKIVGGQDSELGEYPFLVAIFRNGTFHCGGSIIHKSWILSAAHCFHSQEKYVFEIQAGMMRKYSWSPYEQTRQVVHIYSHEKYEATIFKNDIALLELNSDLHLSKYVADACLAPEDKSLDPKPHQLCSIIGWGNIAETTHGPDTVQEVELPVKEKCHESFTNDFYQICAGVVEGGKDACQGDSGGPLVCKDDNGRRIVCGLVSFGRGCARANQFGVYTKVSAYIKWIESVLSGENQMVRKQLQPHQCGSQKCIRSGGECLFDRMICDRNVDCYDASDEKNCQYDKHLFEDDFGFDERAYSEIEALAHVNEEHVHDYGKTKLCGSDEFQCKSTKSCVPISALCTGTSECGDHTDEMNCPCGSVIANSFPEKTCDGLFHCLDGSDETGDCSYCGGRKNKLNCPLSNHCIDPMKWCDGVRNCPNGEDEVDCIRLLRTKSTEATDFFLGNKVSRGLQAGYVVIRREGNEWRVGCSEELSDIDLDHVVCTYLGLSAPTQDSQWGRNTRTARLYIPRTLPVAQGRAPEDDAHRDTEPDTNLPKNCTRVKIRCGEPQCGQRRLYSQGTIRKIPGESLGAHPWLALMMVDGKPLCPVTVVHKEWAIVAPTCVKNLILSMRIEYVTVLSGYSDQTPVVSSPLEQVKRVNAIERDEGSGTALLHLESPFLVDHFLTPICLQSPSDLATLKGSTCVRVGYDGKLRPYEDSITIEFPSKLGDYVTVRLNKQSCERIEPSFVYCSQDGASWFLLGHIPNIDQNDCTRNPQFILKILLNGHLNLGNRIPATTVKPPHCDGIRCSMGNCVGKNGICDGIRQCSGSEDEKRCQRHLLGTSRIAVFEDDVATVSGNVTTSATDDCSPGYFQCQSTGNCVPISAYCNGEQDCGEDDFTDEPIDEAACSCRNYLKLASPEKICDPTGTCHCPDRSDCLGCPCMDASFHCSASTTPNLTSAQNMSSDCIPLHLVCDGRVDCPGTGRDEDRCITLFKSSNFHDLDSELVESTTSEGFVFVRMKGVWHPYCSNDWSMNLFRSICRHLGFDGVVQAEVQDLHEFHSKIEFGFVDDLPKLVIAENEDEDSGSHFKVRYTDDSKESDSEWSSCQVTYLQCGLPVN